MNCQQYTCRASVESCPYDGGSIKDRTFAMICLPLGALVPFGYSIDTPKENEEIDDKNIAYSKYKMAIANNCEIKLFELPNQK